MRDALAQIVGEAHVVDDPAALRRAAGGWNPLVAHGMAAPPRWVVRPADRDEAEAVRGWAAENGVSARPVGGGSSPAPTAPFEIAVDLARLRDLRFDETDLTVDAGAGWTLAELEKEAASLGLTLGHRLGSDGVATVGGSVATDAIGAFSGRYGRFRDSVRAVDARGGWIYGATLALWPEPEARAWAIVEFDAETDARDALRLIHRSDARPALARIVDRTRLILAFEGDEIVQAAHYQLSVAVCQKVGGTLSGGTDAGEKWWEKRARTDVWAANARDGVWADCVAVGASWGVLTDVLDGVRRHLQTAGQRSEPEICHPNPHGAALEIVFTLEGATAGAYRAFREDLCDVVRSRGGVPHHHFGPAAG